MDQRKTADFVDELKLKYGGKILPAYDGLVIRSE